MHNCNRHSSRFKSSTTICPKIDSDTHAIQGVSYTTATQTVPTLLTLPSAAEASATFHRAKLLAARHSTVLSILSISAYTIAYAFAPRSGRHPYLLWTGLTVAMGAGADYFLSARDQYLREKERGKPRSKVEEDDYEDVNGSVRFNGEEVRKAVEGWQGRELVKCAFSGAAFCMGTVGIFGDMA